MNAKTTKTEKFHNWSVATQTGPKYPENVRRDVVWARNEREAMDKAFERTGSRVIISVTKI